MAQLLLKLIQYYKKERVFMMRTVQQIIDDIGLSKKKKPLIIVEKMMRIIENKLRDI